MSRDSEWLSSEELDSIEEDAKFIIACSKGSDDITFSGHSVFDDGVNLVPMLVQEIRKYRLALDAKKPIITKFVGGES